MHHRRSLTIRPLAGRYAQLLVNSNVYAVLAASLFLSWACGADPQPVGRAARPNPLVATVPIEWSPGELIVLFVSVNGRRPVKFILDTGAEFSILGSEYARDLGLPAETRNGRAFKRVTLSLAGLTLRQQQVMVMPFERYHARGRNYHGMVGSGFFQRYVVTIDYHGRRLLVYEPGPFRHAPEAIRVPITFSGRLPVVPARLLFTSGKPLLAQLMLDTGASQAVFLRQPFASANHLFALAAGEEGTAPSFASGPQRFVRIPVQGVLFAGRTLRLRSVRAFVQSIGSGGFTDTDGILGSDVLHRFRPTIDYSRRLLSLTPNEHLNDKFIE